MRLIPLFLPLLCACSADPLASTSPTVVWELGVASFSAGAHWRDFQLQVPVTGRYRCEIELESQAECQVWIEAYPSNADGRTYDITGPVQVPAGTGLATREGSPLQAGLLPMRLHVAGDRCTVRSVSFTLMRTHTDAPVRLEQQTEGDEWALVWSDEFDGEGLPDPDRWTHDVGDWGWGNRELQYYTEGRTENARQEDGRLIIEAHPTGNGRWTSARLTTRGKVDFLYGRIEMRAKAPSTDGTWAAGWALGAAYRDELSWRYCGEIDICEAVGREIDDTTKDSTHTQCIVQLGPQ